MFRCLSRWALLGLVHFAVPVAAEIAPTAPSEAVTAVPAPRVLPQPPADLVIPSRAELIALIDREAARQRVDPVLVHAIVRAESNYDPRAVSPAGAVGVMQVMPETAADYGVTAIDALFDPQTNVRTGIRHLKRLLSRYGIGKAVMAYNAGEGALERSNGFVTYPETQIYTHRVLTRYLRDKGLPPYSAEAAQLTGLPLDPAMAQAQARAPADWPSAVAEGPRLPPAGTLRQPIALSNLSLQLRPALLDSALPRRALDPALHRVGPESKPMFELKSRPTLVPRD